MNKLAAEAEALARAVVEGVKGCPNRVMIAPPFTALERVARVVSGTPVVLGAQNMGPETSGAHTGEVSPAMLRDVGVRTVILGHSERRHAYGEQDALINRKVRLAIEQGLEVILCVGETLEQREAGQTRSTVERQVTAVLEAAGVPAFGKAVIAYEPVWAIGTGRTATPEQAQEVHSLIRTMIAARDATIAAGLTILNGGSVKGANARNLFAMDDIDGGLVGGASLVAADFLEIFRAAA